MIDGETLPLLSEEHLLDTLGLKLGPALKIRSQVQKHRFWLEMQSRATKDRIWRDYLMYEDKSWIKVYLRDPLFIQLHVRRLCRISSKGEYLKLSKPFFLFFVFNYMIIWAQQHFCRKLGLMHIDCCVSPPFHLNAVQALGNWGEALWNGFINILAECFMGFVWKLVSTSEPEILSFGWHFCCCCCCRNKLP